MSSLLPLFPLPTPVLFPNVFLPLHIFEPRYREMVADALQGDRLIGMILLKPGWEPDYEGRPPVFPIGTSGLITHAERIPDGRFNIVLRGIEKFRILTEEPGRSYRLARVEPLTEALDGLGERDREAVRQRRQRLEALLSPTVDRVGADTRIPAAMPDDDLVNALAQYLDLEPVEKQALLEREGLLARCDSLVELLEMKLIAARGAGGSPLTH